MFFFPYNCKILKVIEITVELGYKVLKGLDILYRYKGCRYKQVSL
jgi:hypothetical protein